MRTTIGRVTPQMAHDILATCNVPIGADFHALHTNIVLDIIEQADKYHYHKPQNANGSRARYFHDALQKRAQRT